MSDEIETVGKVADAAKEVAATSGKAIDAASGVGRFFERVMGDLVTDAVGIISDKIRYYRTENAITLAMKTEERLKALNITTFRVVPPKIAIPLIEQATLEDEPDLQVMWANLLAAAMGATEHDITKKYVSALSEMTSAEALLFEYLVSYSEHRLEKDLALGEGNNRPVPYAYPSFEPGLISHLLEMDENSFDEAMRNLGRVGLVTSGEERALDSFQQFPELDGMELARKFREDAREGVYEVRAVSVVQDITEKVKLTPFGSNFAEAVGIERISGSEFSSLDEAYGATD
jgi:hypothetical protein